MHKHLSLMAMAALAFGLCLMPSCTQDNVHMPEADKDMPAWTTYAQDFAGEFSTTVPVVQEYLQGPLVDATSVRLENFHIEHSGHIRILTKGFDVDDPFVVSLLGAPIEIGDMRLEDVEYAAFPSGGGYFRKLDFDIQAGAYRTRGSVEGSVSKEGKLPFVMKYRPGTMPFEIITEFRQEVP